MGKGITLPGLYHPNEAGWQSFRWGGKGHSTGYVLDFYVPRTHGGEGLLRYCIYLLQRSHLCNDTTSCVAICQPADSSICPMTGVVPKQISRHPDAFAVTHAPTEAMYPSIFLCIFSNDWCYPQRHCLHN